MSEPNIITRPDKSKTLSLAAIDSIRDQANRQRNAEFRRGGWGYPKQLTTGDVRVVLEAYLNASPAAVVRAQPETGDAAT